MANTTNFNGELGRYQRLECGEYIADNDGVSVLARNGDEIRVCTMPIRPVRIFQNIQTGKQKIEIAYGETLEQKVLIDRSMVAAPNQITRLADYGVPVDANTARHLMGYFTACLANGEIKLPCVKSSAKLGWHKCKRPVEVDENNNPLPVRYEDVFVPYSSEIKCDAATEGGSNDILKGITASGTLEEWREFVNPLRSKLPVRIALATSFASVLLYFANSLPFVLHMWGASGGGKTVTLWVAASVWGNPSALVHTMNSTVQSMMQTADLMNHLPVFSDELQTLRGQLRGNDFHAHLENMVYQLAEGIGRSRLNSNGTQQTVGKWKNTFLFSGEEPIVGRDSQDGARNRLIQIHVENDVCTRTEGATISNFVSRCYGSAGQAFISAIQRETDFINALIESLSAYAQQFSDRGVTGKQAASAALLMAADELARMWVYGDDRNALTVDDLLPFLVKNADLDRAGAAYECACDIDSSNAAKFIDVHGVAPLNGEIWGKFPKVVYAGDEYTSDSVFISQNVLVRELQKAGFGFDAIKHDWVKRGFIIPVGKERRIATRQRIKNVQTMCVQLKLEKSDSYSD